MNWKRIRPYAYVVVPMLFVVGVWMIGIRLYRDYLEAVAVEAVQSAGGIIQANDGSPYRVHFEGGSWDDQAFLRLVPHLRHCPQLVELDLVQCRISDVSLKSISQIPQLRELYIFETSVTEAGVANLQKQCPELQIKNETPDPIASQLVSTNIYRHAINTLAWGRDGATFVTGSGDGRLRWWNFADAEVQQDDEAHADWLFTAAFSPDKRLLATGGGDNLIALWDAQTRKQLGKIAVHTDDVHAVVFSADGKVVFSTSDDLSVRRTVLPQFAERPIVITDSSVMGYHDDTVPCIAIAPDGGLVATGSRDDSIQLWNAGEGTLIRKLTGHTDDVITVAFLPTVVESRDGPVLASGSYDGSIRLWNTQSGESIGIMQGHTGRVYSIDVSKDGSTIASAGEDGVIVWDVVTRQLEHRVQNIENASCVRFRDGNQMVVTDAMGTISLVETSTGRIVHRAHTSRATFALR